MLPKTQKSIQPSSVCFICVSSIIFYLTYNIDLLNLSNFKSELYIIIILSQFNVLAVLFQAQLLKSWTQYHLKPFLKQ